MATLRAQHLSKSYAQRLIIEDVSLDVRSGEVVGLLGPNGAGKTTAFYMIVGIVAADGGEILLDNKTITRLPMHERARRGIGYLPQEASVFRKLSTAKNIKAILQLRRDLDRAAKKTELERLISEFHLERVRGELGERLSGGERRRVEIARALASAPKFVLLDEPFAGIDPISVADIKSMVRDLAKRGIGILITDHNAQDTLDICDRAYIVSDGHIIAEGDTEAILSNEKVRDVYLGDEFKY